MAEVFGCSVVGIDVTPDFVNVANALTARVGLAEKVTFQEASALDLPFEDASFDAAVLLHVGMNIADKGRLFSEVRRVLRPGSRFGVYEVMRLQAGEIPMPMPWAETGDVSFVETPETYARA